MLPFPSLPCRSHSLTLSSIRCFWPSQFPRSLAVSLFPSSHTQHTHTSGALHHQLSDRMSAHARRDSLRRSGCAPTRRGRVACLPANANNASPLPLNHATLYRRIRAAPGGVVYKSARLGCDFCVTAPQSPPLSSSFPLLLSSSSPSPQPLLLFRSPFRVMILPQRSAKNYTNFREQLSQIWAIRTDFIHIDLRWTAFSNWRFFNRSIFSRSSNFGSYLKFRLKCSKFGPLGVNINDLSCSIYFCAIAATSISFLHVSLDTTLRALSDFTTR